MKTIYQLSDENAIGKSKLAKIGGDSSKWTEKNDRAAIKTVQILAKFGQNG